MKNELGINNILHVAELCLALPISNPESERVYSYLWRVYSEDRHSLKNETLEHVLRLRCGDDFSTERYSRAVDIFLNQYPNGDVRKGSRTPDGHNYPKNRKSRKTNDYPGPSIDALNAGIASSDEEDNGIDDIDIENISADENEWSDIESDNEQWTIGYLFTYFIGF